MKIIFTLNPVGFAGTEISTLKLADSVARLRKVTSVLCFTDKAPDGTYLQRIKAEFKSISVIHEKVIGEPEELRELCQSQGVHAVFTMISAPKVPELFSRVLDILFLQCVCQTRPLEARWFTYNSAFLAREFSGDQDNWLPHIVQLPDHSVDLRQQLQIPEGARVFGRLGGPYSWNIRFVDALLEKYTRHKADAYFLFANTPRIWPYMDDTRRFIHIAPIVFNEVLKRAFINTCDAMIHARPEGETFGLACAEFAFANRPVITYAHSPEKAHLEMLGDLARPYDSPASLWYALDTAREARGTNSAYKHFSEAVVTKRFMDIVCSPS